MNLQSAMVTLGISQYEARNLEELRMIAYDLDCELIVAKPNELFLDIDGGFQSETLTPQLELIAEKFQGAKITQQWKSRSGVGTHFVIELGTALAPPLMIALQAALGSDPTREILAAWEWMTLQQDTRSLFKPKEK